MNDMYSRLKFLKKSTSHSKGERLLFLHLLFDQMAKREIIDSASKGKGFEIFYPLFSKYGLSINKQGTVLQKLKEMSNCFKNLATISIPDEELGDLYQFTLALFEEHKNKIEAITYPIPTHFSVFDIKLDKDKKNDWIGIPEITKEIHLSTSKFGNFKVLLTLSCKEKNHKFYFDAEKKHTPIKDANL